MKKVINTDTLLGAAGVLLGLILLVTSYRLNESVFVLPGDAPPLLVPQMVLYLCVAVSLAILIAGLVRGGRNVDGQRWWHILGMAVVVCGATFLMNSLGYLVVAPVAVILTCLVLDYRNHFVNAAVAVFVTGAIYLLLTRFAHMPLPKLPGLGL